MKCAVFDCKNRKTKKSNLSFFIFPKENKLKKQWLRFCRLDERNWKFYDKVCIEHFKPEDIKGDMKLKMGFATRRFLNPDAVPSIHVKPTPSAQNRVRRLEKRNNKKIVNALLEEPSSTYSNKVFRENIRVAEEPIIVENDVKTESAEIPSPSEQRFQEISTKQIVDTLFSYTNELSTEKLCETEEYIKVENEVTEDNFLGLPDSEGIQYDDIIPENSSLVEVNAAEIDYLKSLVRELRKKNKTLNRQNVHLRHTLLQTKKKFACEKKILGEKLIQTQHEEPKSEVKLQESFTTGEARKLENGSIRQNLTETGNNYYLLCLIHP